MNLKNISIVLHQPRYPENIGAAARAICNMGLGQLVVVDPKNCDLTKVLKMATHVASEVVEEMELCANIKEALSPYNYVVGTTARLGSKRQGFSSPSKLAEKLVALSDNNRIAILFGPEDRGLSNTDLRYCHAVVNIPTADFSSINLAQAVMIVCYEIFIADRKEGEEFSPRLASRHELDGMYDQLKEILVRIGYINPDNPDYWLNKVRYFFNRLKLQAREVSIIRGICRQVNWYSNKRYDDGLKTGKKDS
jgi:tRNA/rRNA methyltransferase